jgi:hypothetical protein
VRQSLRSTSIGLTALVLFFSVFTLAQAQNTADPFISQITSSGLGSFAGGINSTGRFVVIESTGDITTERTGTRNNADGNREIFLFDYVQRRIFQITDTKSARTDATKPFFDPAKGPNDRANIRVEVSNNRPVISFNGRWIAFTSNAATPASFDGDANSASLIADGNQEVWVYFIPAVPADSLSSGAEVTPVDLTTGTFTQVTNTPASRVPEAGTATVPPFVADDNRDVAVNDNASLVAFISNRNLTGGNGETNPNPEVFIFNRTTSTTTQVTNTQGNFIFSQNPSLSGDGSVMAFLSTANIPDTAGGTGNNSDANAEVYVATLNPGAATVLSTRQVTRTTTPVNGSPVNLLSPGQRLSRDGTRLAFESLADLAGNSSNLDRRGLFIYNIGLNSFTSVLERLPNNAIEDVFRFPTFTGDNTTLVFVSSVNLNPNGTFNTSTTEGLNPPESGFRRIQLFSAPVSSLNTLTRLTNNSIAAGGNPQPFVSETRRRIAFSMAGIELGGGNADNLAEAFYLLTPPATPVADSSVTVSYFTGASLRPVVGPSPPPTPPSVAGLAPGMIGIARSATALAPSNQEVTSNFASVSRRRPPLPIELNGVSVAINGAAAGLYFVGNTPTNEIRFVVPPGLIANTGTATYAVVINNNGTLLRSTLHLLPILPDIFTSTGGAGGRADVTNVTNALLAVGTPEPFTVTTTYMRTNAQGQVETVTEPTILRIFLTGINNLVKTTAAGTATVRGQTATVTVRIGNTAITGNEILRITPTDTAGFDQLDVRLPAGLAGAGDVPIIVEVTLNNVTYTSRPADTAPRIQIN